MDVDVTRAAELEGPPRGSVLESCLGKLGSCFGVDVDIFWKFGVDVDVFWKYFEPCSIFGGAYGSQGREKEQ